MDRYLAWINTLPPLLRGVVVVASVLAGLIFIGVVTEFVMWEPRYGADKNKLTRKDLLKNILLLPVHLAGQGLFVSVCFATILGPYFLLLSIFRWPYLLALLIGLPMGLSLLILLLLVAIGWGHNRSKGKS